MPYRKRLSRLNALNSREIKNGVGKAITLAFKRQISAAAQWEIGSLGM
jgi:hypothetical protein